MCTAAVPFALVLEYAPLGELRHLLRQLTELSHEHMSRMALSVARGMDFLSRRQVVHRDLAARNILVSNFEQGKLKISDFGMAKLMENGVYVRPKTLREPLPLKWMAPESISDRTFSSASDMWSFKLPSLPPTTSP